MKFVALELGQPLHQLFHTFRLEVESAVDEFNFFNTGGDEFFDLLMDGVVIEVANRFIQCG